MPVRDGWKVLRPEEQMLQLIRQVRSMKDSLRKYTRIQGVRLETRVVAGERRLYATITDPNATNSGATYQIAP